ncbi:peptidase [Streptomyces kanamyceticus]|uniref:peptidase n=1 Tax=Streptomyces kanamyceticus TaxID=1967 RepID=UPI000B0DB0AF|nr:peptidase [Streptomyces kanamyceticus]
MALGPSAPSLFELRDGALKYGAYTEVDGAIKGLIYAPFAEYAREAHGVDATVHRHLSVEEIITLLDEGRQVIASVHYEIRRPHRPAPGRGGHLVLLTRRTAEGLLHFHNPSGIDARSRTAELSADEFEPFFAGRGVSLP